MANASYDTLTIQINADSKEANKSIASLNRNLNNLDKTAKELNTRRIGEVKGLLLNIAKIDFSNVSKGLQDIVSAFKYFNSTANSKKNSKTSPFSFIQGMSTNFLKERGLDQVSKAFNNLDFSKSLEASVEPQIDKFKELKLILKDLHLSASQTNTIFNALGMSVNTLNEEKIQAIAKALANAGKSTKDIEKVVKALREEMQELEETTGKTGNNFARMFKNILKYRVVRKLIQSVFQEITQAFTDLASIDDGFNQSLGEIKSAFSFIGRSLVSIIAPIIKAIAPIITLIAQSVNEVANMLGGALASSLGEDFYEAQEGVESYTDSLKKAQSTTMGFDKLNIISKDKGSGFVLSDKQITTTGKLAELFNELTSKLKNLLEQLSPQISTIAYSIVSLLEKSTPLIIELLELTMELISLTDDSVNISISTFIELLGSMIKNLASFIRLFKPLLSGIIVFTARILNAINQIMTMIFYIVNIANEFFAFIHNSIVDLINGDFNAIKKNFIDVCNSVVRTAVNMIISFINPLVKVVYNIFSQVISYINRAIETYNKIANKFGWTTIDTIQLPDFVDNIASFLSSGISYSYNPLYTETDFNPNNNRSNVSNQGNNGGGDIVIQIDGREVARAVNKANSNNGSKLGWGGNLNYGE